VSSNGRKWLEPRSLQGYLLVLVIGLSLGGCRRSESAKAQLPPSASPADLIAQSDQFYSQRSDLTKVRSAITRLNEARVTEFSNYDALWRLSRANYFLGAHTEVEAERENSFKAGVDAGKAAIKSKENGVEGHFWLGANYGGQAQASALAGLSSLDDIRNEMQTVIKLNPGYEGGSAYMVLGQVDTQAPKLMGGDLSQAISTLEKGVKDYPDNSMMHLRLAQAYEKSNRLADAQKQISEIEQMKPDTAYLPEHQDVLKELPKLKEELAERNSRRA
jgi:tetratricopeptide (TPR) repeat protein